MRTPDDRWAEEPFLRAACDAMVADLDWDSLDSGRLHRATSSAKTLAGGRVVIGVLDRADRLEELLLDAEEEKRGNDLPVNTPVWLYVPADLGVPRGLPESVVVKTISTHLR
jgi:hypothetical protein